MELKIDNAAIEKLIQEHVRTAVTTALATKSDYLIGRLVAHAMEEKDPRSYGRETILENSINAMIRKEATDAIAEWLDTKRADIRKQVFAAVSKKSDGLVAKIVERLVLGLGDKLSVKAYLDRE